MAYEPYVTSDYYKNEYGGTIVPEEQLAKALRKASRHIDTLTYNRIVGQGFSNLTAFQQADFEVENADMINTVLQSYSINGVAMQFGGSWNVLVGKGVAMRADVYAQLCQTGLCCRLAR